MHAKHAFKPTAVETLESREVLSGFSAVQTFSRLMYGLPAGVVSPAVATPVTPQAGPNMILAKMGSVLTNLYNAYQAKGTVAAISSAFPQLQFQGDSVSVMISTTDRANLNAFVGELKNLGMQVSASNSTYGLVTGNIPVSAIGTIAALPTIRGASPIMKPVHN
jgi:hypothetical protein